MQSGPLALHLEGGDDDSLNSTPVARPVDDDDDDDGSDDDILLMAKAKKPVPPASAVPRPAAFNPRRRDTNISIASTETAKKIPVHGDEGASHYEA